MNDKGYVMGLFSFLLILPVFLMMMMLVNLAVSGADIQQTRLTSDEVFSVAQDLETNLPQIGREVLRDKSEEVIKSGNPLSNSRKEIKDELQNRMDILCSKYDYSGIKTKCKILSVKN